MAVSRDAGGIEVIVRKRIAFSDPDLLGAVQPFHFAEKLNASEAANHLKTCAEASERFASMALRQVVREIEGRGYRVAGCGLLTASGRPLPALAEILASHALIHAAEGEFFRDAVRRACDQLQIRICGYRQKDLSAQAKSAFGAAAPRIRIEIENLGRALGPPWTSDQKTATLAACLFLAGERKPSARRR
ncbi:MAG: hypothetical protein KGL59_07800 [Acidobacteriota bacterium]|nr:hypothetical protein [Acidobacteriota bacterium]